MAKVLLVDTNFSSGPIHDELTHLGHEVHVVGGSLSDCLAKASDRHWHIDYSDTEALNTLIEREAFDFLVPGCTDRSYTSCAVVNQGRFPGIESIEIDQKINNKELFRLFAKELDLPVPQVQDETVNLRWPLIVKPVDAFSGKGITLLDKPDHAALNAAISLARKTSKSGRFLIEDFVAGDLYSHSAFLSNGKVCMDFIVREDSTVNQFVVDTSRVIYEPPVKLMQNLRESIEKLAEKLTVKDGLIHSQFIYDGDQIWLIELTRRCPGDLYSQLIELSTGFKYINSYVRPFLGMPPISATNLPFHSLVMRHTVTVPESQNYSYIKYKLDLKIERWVALSLVGDQLKPSPASRLGILFTKANSEIQMDAIYGATLRRELYEIGQ